MMAQTMLILGLLAVRSREAKGRRVLFELPVITTGELSAVGLHKDSSFLFPKAPDRKTEETSIISKLPAVDARLRCSPENKSEARGASDSSSSCHSSRVK